MKPQLKNVIKACFILLLVPCIFKTNAQTNENRLTKLYLQGGAGASTRAGGFAGYGLQGVVKNKWSFTLSYYDIIQEPGNLPSDYEPESGIILFLPYTNQVEVNMKLYSITGGKFFPLGRNIWFTAEGGISLVQGEKASFVKTSQEEIGFLIGWSTTSNYKTTIEKKTAFGAMLKADFNWAFCRFAGLGTGVFANLNSIQSPIGYEVRLTLGALGRQRKLKKQG
jgi:hypothetical protein